MTLLDPRSREADPRSRQQENIVRPRNRRRAHCYDLMAVNLAVAVVLAICLAVMGDRVGLEMVAGSSRYEDDWAGGIAFAAFSVLFAMVAALVCISRVRALSWIFTSFAIFFLAVNLIVTGTALYEI